MVFSHRQELRVTFPHTIDEVGIIGAGTLEQAIAQIDVKLIEISLIQAGSDAINNGVINICPNLTHGTVAKLHIKHIDNGQRRHLKQIVIGKSTLAGQNLAASKISHFLGRITNFSTNQLHIAGCSSQASG